MSLTDRFEPNGPKRILSLDGGGARGLISLGYLERMEALLQERFGADFRLHQYFDLIGGSSTGAIISTLLCLGWRPAEIRELYLQMLPKVFKPRGGLMGLAASVGFRTKFDGAQFSRAMDEAFKAAAARAGTAPELMTFETSELLTGLAVFAKRIDTGAVWVQTNNPRRKYWTPSNAAFHPDGAVFYPNRDYHLKKVVEASASAPYFVDPVDISIDPDQPGLFVDGGASPVNNPSQELFFMTTLREAAWAGAPDAPTPFGFGWPTGADTLLMISVGTGHVRAEISPREYKRLLELKQAIHALRTIIADADVAAVSWMQAISRHVDPWTVNSNLGAMRGMRIVDAPLLSYQRYNQTIDGAALTDLLGAEWGAANLRGKALEHLREFDAVDRKTLRRFAEIGAAAAEAQVKPAHFPAAFDRLSAPAAPASS